MKYLLVFISLVTLVGCLGGAGEAVESSTPPPSDPTPDPTPDPPLQAVTVQQINIVDATLPPTVFSTSGTVLTMGIVVVDPLGQEKCTWEQIVPAQPALGFPVEVQNFIGTLNGPCNTTVDHTQNNLNVIYRVTANNSESTVLYTFDLNWTDGLTNNPVSVTKDEPTGTEFRATGSHWFKVDSVDNDVDGTCVWELDGVTVSNSCHWYYYTEDGDADHVLDFTIDDGVNAIDSVSWVVGPKATITIAAPASVNLANGNSQAYTVTLDDPFTSGAMCEFLLDGVLAQARGACTYNYTSDGNAHDIAVDVVYAADGSKRNGEPSVLYAAPIGNQAVSITASSHTSGVYYFDRNDQTNYFDITAYSDPDGDAEFKWYVGGVLIDCDLSAVCTYANAQKEGFRLDDYDGRDLEIKAVLTDGQNSDEFVWTMRLKTPEINASAVAGPRCYKSGTTFSVFGAGFEVTDEFKLMNQDVTLMIQSFSYTHVVLKLPADVIVGNQIVQVTKSAVVVQSASDFVTFTSAVCP